MKEVILCLIAGFAMGAVFKSMNLPSPSPPIFAGVMGIVGVYFGGKVIEWCQLYMKIGG
jgi:XapX domain-containing protein